MRLVLALVAGSLALPLGGASAAASESVADRIFVGGEIVTVAGAMPTAEAVAIADGKIVAVGSESEVMVHKGDATEVIDLEGKTLVPGFIDPHSHFISSLAMAGQANVSAPPVGPAADPDAIVAELKRFVADRGIQPGELVIGYGYDPSLMPAGQELSRDILDAAFPDNPVLVIHVSMHGAVLNSKSFEKWGITAETPTPPGGVIARKPGSEEPSGLVMETAYLPIFGSLPAPTPDELADQIRYGQDLYAAAGVTTAQEGATHANQVEILKTAAADELLFIDVVAYPFITDLDAVLAANPASSFGSYDNHLKLGGAKITADGSPQGLTAYFTTPYLVNGPGGETDWRGEPTFPQAELDAMVAQVYGLNLPLIIHANGDAAIDMVLSAHEKAAAGDAADADRRTTVIHSQFVRSDQLEAYVRDKLIPSFYTEHTFFFSGAHNRQRGPEQTAFISPMKSAIDLGLNPTNHTDFNVVPIDHLLVMWSAVTRQDRDGNVIGPDERISALDALKAVTINAAYQYFEEDTKGSIEVGKLADFAILSANPLTVDPNDIREIKVMETIKDGRTIYRRDAD